MLLVDRYNTYNFHIYCTNVYMLLDEDSRGHYISRVLFLFLYYCFNLLTHSTISTSRIVPAVPTFFRICQI